jgi:glucokinase
MKSVIGIDLGGTNVRAGLVAGSKLTKLSESSLDLSGGKNKILEQLYYVIKQVAGKNTEAIGVGVPGVVDTQKGIVYDVVNIPSWKKVPLKKLLEDRFGFPVKINNDANCFVMGEKFFGKGRNAKNIVGLIIGTGLGAGIIIDNKLYEGSNCGAGEFGMIPFKDDILETYCSGQFFKKYYKISGSDLYKLNNKKSTKIYTEFGKNIAEAIKIILYSYDPEIIILGGSVSHAYPLFKTAMLEGLNTFAYSRTVSRIKICTSGLKYPGILGAAGLVSDFFIA